MVWFRGLLARLIAPRKPILSAIRASRWKWIEVGAL
jgi:hypothetical protein